MTFLKHLAFLALGGLIAVAVAFALGSGSLQNILGLLGALAIVPVIFYLVVLTAWHWKSRYRGRHSDLWGALLLIETSGWFKIIYLFRHLLPDYWSTGRYRPGGDTVPR